MLLRRCAACPPSGSPRRATAHRSVRFVSVRVSAFCPPYDSARTEHPLSRADGLQELRDLDLQAPTLDRERLRRTEHLRRSRAGFLRADADIADIGRDLGRALG